MVVSNHQSSLDLLGMMEVLPDRCVPIAKRELLYMGAVGVVCWLGGIIFIDRKRTHDAISVMAEAAHTMLSQDVRVWVFPEGTRNHSGSMLPFKRGAFHLAVQAQVPVVPIVISSYQHFYSKRERRFTAGHCVIQVLPPLPTRGLGPADVPALTECVRAAMLRAFEALSAELGDHSDHPSDHSDHRSDQHTDQPSDHRSDHSDHPSDHSDHPSDPLSNQLSDHRSDQRSDPLSDRPSDQHSPTATPSDQRSDPWSDQHSPTATQSDQRSDQRSDQWSDQHSPAGLRDPQSDPQSDQQSPTATSDPQSDRPSPTAALNDPWSDHQSDHQSDQQSDHQGPPCPSDPWSDPWSDPRSDPWSDPQHPTAPWSDPQCPALTHGVTPQ
ncbi:clumping factor B-like isoform X1 [Passer domesticus]|uniref:clumping factor B-like isoform X1 n=1 Tax=Passer domesticus TaxID=48849 RepID=UPI0030FF060A